MPDVASLSVVVDANISGLESGLSRANQQVSGFGSQLSGAFGIAATAASALGAGIAAGIGVGVKSAGDLEQAVANISTIKPEIDTSAVFAALNTMSTQIPQTAAQLGDSLYNVFSSLDVGQEQALQLVETFSKGAVGAQTSAETFGTAVMGVMNAYGLSVEDAAHISDVFFNTVNKGVITGQELAASLGPVTQSAKAAGVGLDELGAMIAAVTKEGGPAAQNVNNLNNFLQKVTTKEAQKELNALGVATKTATGEFRPTTEVLEDLKERLGGMTEAARANALQAIFPDAQARQGAQTLISQLGLVKSATQENIAATGVAATAYETMSATFNSQSKLLMNGLTSILTTVGAMLLPAITPLVTAFAQSLPAAFQAAMTAIAPFVAVLTQMIDQIRGGDFAGAFSTFLTAAQSVGAQLLTVVQGWGRAFLDWIVPLIPAIIANLQVMANNIVVWLGQQVPIWGAQLLAWGEAFVSWIGPMIPPMLAALGAMALAIADWIIGQTPAITAALVEWGLLFAAWVVTSAIPAFNEQSPKFNAALGEWVINAARELGQRALAFGQALAQGIYDGFVAAWAQIGPQIVAAIGGWWDALVADAQARLDMVTTVVTVAWDGILAYFGGIGPALVAAVQGAWDAILAETSAKMDEIRAAIIAVWVQIPEDIRADLVLITTHLATAGAEWVTSVTATGQQILTALAASGAEWVTSVTTTVQAMWTAITAKLAEILTAVTTWAADSLAQITGLIAPATTAAGEIGSGILTALSGKLAEIIAAVQGFGRQVIGALQGLVGEAGAAAAAIGAAIVNGIRGAIQAGVNSIASAAADAVRRALNAAKDAAGIKSPSKVFALEIGQPIVEGIVVGMDSQRRDLARAMESLIPFTVASASVSTDTAGTVGNDSPLATLATLPTLPRVGRYGSSGGGYHGPSAKEIAAELAAVLPRRGDVVINGAGTEEVASKVLRHFQKEELMYRIGG